MLDQALDLLGHDMHTKDLPEVHILAMRALVAQLRKRKRAVTVRPRSSTPSEKTADPAAPARTQVRDTDAAAPERKARDTDGAAPERRARDTDGAAPERRARDTDGAAPERSTSPVAFERSDGAHRNRHIPAAVARSVWARDGDRCVYVDARGQRCRETRGLELHHRRAHALGGPPTVDNLEIRCRVHNLLAAEHDFGRERMERARGVT